MAYDPEYHAAYYQANKEKKRLQGKLWAEKNKDKIAESRRKQHAKNPEAFRERTRKWERTNPEKVLYKAAKNRAKAKEWDFDIEIEDVVIPTHCPLLGIELVPRQGGHGAQDASPSLDRIDASKGYVKGNVWVISAIANRIKTNATPEQIMTVAQNLQKLVNHDS